MKDAQDKSSLRKEAQTFVNFALENQPLHTIFEKYIVILKLEFG